jgi:hypothetical protein
MQTNEKILTETFASSFVPVCPKSEGSRHFCKSFSQHETNDTQNTCRNLCPEGTFGGADICKEENEAVGLL